MNGIAKKLREQLKESGNKLTTQRRAVLDVIVEHVGEYLSTEEIFGYVKKKCPEIGLATVYRTLLLIDRLKMVCKMDLDDGCNRYKLNLNKEEHEQHLVCTYCGNITEIQEDLLDLLEDKILENNNFHVKTYYIKFFGCCSECRNKEV